MPGSPAMSESEPSMMPPPITRSNSFSPVTRRGCSATSTSVMRCAFEPVVPRPNVGTTCITGALTAERSVSSTNVFHSSQSGHLPIQRCAVWPQLWHVKIVLGLAIRSVGWDPRRESGVEGVCENEYLSASGDAGPRTAVDASGTHPVYTPPVTPHGRVPLVQDARPLRRPRPVRAPHGQRVPAGGPPPALLPQPRRPVRPRRDRLAADRRAGVSVYGGRGRRAVDLPVGGL